MGYSPWWSQRVGHDLVTITPLVHHHLGLLAFQTVTILSPRNSSLSLLACHVAGSKSLDSVTVLVLAKQKKSKEDFCFYQKKKKELLLPVTPFQSVKGCIGMPCFRTAG